MQEEKPQRFCFESDEDCHKYLIPLELREEFNRLLYPKAEPYSIEWDKSMDELNEKFSQYRCGHVYHYSFTDPQNI